MTEFGNLYNNTNIEELTVDVDGQSVTLGQLVQKVNTLEHQDGGGDGIDNTRLTAVENGLTSIQSRIQQMEDAISGLHPSQGGSEGSGETTEIQQAILALNQRLAELEQQLNSHLSDKGNPHVVTKSQVGLGNVKNQAVTVTSSSVSDGTTTFSQFDPSSIHSAISDIQANKQNNLVSGQNIKTLNGQSLLGSGNIQISSGSGSAEPQDTT